MCKLNLFEHFSEIDEAIELNSQDWTLTRLPKVSLAILRLAVAEIKYIDENYLNEAIEIIYNLEVASGRMIDDERMYNLFKSFIIAEFIDSISFR